ncbi:MAG: amidohydrolase [Liquorilactobacillus ghanensis]|uniref:amidohydrolase n=1 Tax=Liquorilactobacillus ghanensis TaxID=399370 RepID=UPI0039EBC81E
MRSLFKNGKIFLGVNEKQFCSAMVIENDLVLWTGNNSECFNKKVDRIIDLKGATVLPGLIDIHTHPKYIADALHGVACTPPKVNSIADIQRELRNSKEYGKGQNWIEGWGFDETKLAEHRSPNLIDLDQVSVKQPIFIYRSDCHSSVGNSKALELAGINANTPNPEGGEIKHFETGEPTGFMKEIVATQLLIKAKSSQSYFDDVNNMVNSSQHYLKNGIVAIGELMGRKKPYDTAKLYEDAVKRGFVPKVAIYYVYDELINNEQNLTKLMNSKFEDKRIMIRGIKIFMDGSISGQTAYTKQPYYENNCGLCLLDEAALKKRVTFACKHHLQLAIHAMGDAAIQLILDVTKNLSPWLKDRPSIRIEHATLLSNEMIQQLKLSKMNYAVVTQPIFLFAESDSYYKYLNQQQLSLTYRLNSLIKSGILTALSSDAPCTPWFEPDSPFYNIYAAVTRKTAKKTTITPTEKITINQAILGYTKWAAEIGGLHENGELSQGKKADFVILSDDVFEIPEESLKNVYVTETWVNGEKVYGN